MCVLRVQRCGSMLAIFVVLTAVAMGQTPSPQTTDQSPPHGKVLFSRDLDSPTDEKEAKAKAEQRVDVTGAERSSLTFTAYDLDVHLTPAESKLSVHAGVT